MSFESRWILSWFDPRRAVRFGCLRTGCSGEKERALSGAGVQVLRVESGDSGVDIASALKELGRKRISSILVEGGGRVLGSFLESGFADEFHFFYAPKILGDPAG